MTETLDLEPQANLDNAARRAAIEIELRKDAGRSDREIARVVGCDHKTVGSARTRLGIASPLGNSPEIAGCKDFDSKYPSASGAKGMVKLAPDEPALDDPAIETFWQIPHQAAIECRPVADGGVDIWQEGQHGRDEDVIIHVAAGNVVHLARLMLYAAGFRSIGIYTHEGGGNVDVEDGHLASNFYVDDDKPGYGPVR
jgi:hypothetical protein